MPITINGSGTITGASTLATTVASPTLTTPNINSAQFATVTGTAPLYAARAWVNFNGTGTVAIRASGNVSSITDNGTGDYTVNFTTAIADANYSAVGTAGFATASRLYILQSQYAAAPTTSALRLTVAGDTSTALDPDYVNMAIFR